MKHNRQLHTILCKLKKTITGNDGRIRIRTEKLQNSPYTRYHIAGGIGSDRTDAMAESYRLLSVS